MSDHPDERCARGLGYNNALFMATELVLLRDGDELALLLVEEPEAHLHPQLQDRVMELLKQHSKEVPDGARRVQVVMTTHSPSLVSSADIETMTMVQKGQTYPLASGHTKLQKTDYSFLQRFIDATKANLREARPLVSGLNVSGPKKLTLNYVLSEKVDEVLGAKKIEATKSHGAAIRLLSGDNSPVAGHHCARCDFSTICPSSPS